MNWSSSPAGRISILAESLAPGVRHGADRAGLAVHRGPNAASSAAKECGRRRERRALAVADHRAGEHPRDRLTGQYPIIRRPPLAHFVPPRAQQRARAAGRPPARVDHRERADHRMTRHGRASRPFAPASLQSPYTSGQARGAYESARGASQITGSLLFPLTGQVLPPRLQASDRSDRRCPDSPPLVQWRLFPSRADPRLGSPPQLQRNGSTAHYNPIVGAPASCVRRCASKPPG